MVPILPTAPGRRYDLALPTGSMVDPG